MLECRLLSINMWSIWLWVFPSGEARVYLWMFRWENINGVSIVNFFLDCVTNMVHAVNIHVIWNTFVLVSVNKQTLYIADHLCFRVTFCVQYWTLYWILPFVFYIILYFPHYSLCSVFPFVLHVRVSYYAFYIRLAKKLPQMKRPENFLKEILRIKWSKYLENVCLWWRSENCTCPFSCSAVSLSHHLPFSCRMIGGVAGRHMSTRRRGSSPLVRLGVPGEQLDSWSAMSPLQPPCSPRYRRRRAVTTSDFKSCALVQTRVKLGDIMWVSMLVLVLSFHVTRVQIA